MQNSLLVAYRGGRLLLDVLEGLKGHSNDFQNDNRRACAIFQRALLQMEG